MSAAPTHHAPTEMWVLFGAIVAISLVIDLIAHRGRRGLGRKAALAWSIGWIAVSFAFAGYVALELGASAAGDFVSAYLMEKSLSVDNLFLFMVVFAQLQVPPAEQHRVLFWGILGALVARAGFIAGGTALLAGWHDIVFVLGAFLLYTGYRTARSDSLHEQDDRTLNWLRAHLPVTSRLHGHHFLARENGKLLATPLLLALLTIELSDIMFAVDSVPAVFAITEEPFIVYSSNVFAILGLRALYLVLADLLRDLRYLQYGLAAILALAGAKLILSRWVHVPAYVSLVAILAILTASIVPSVIARSVQRRRAHAHQ
ncbi:MAG TPA: TerC/Alx family metal homeostasis membrane protein [Kofleriaceae bacterium]|nr:TerC/Alx family metal homeostasis membrane protein [Kofleriaceae bacterium]